MPITPEVVVAALGVISAIFSWLKNKKAEKITESIITGINSYVGDEPGESPEDKLEYLKRRRIKTCIKTIASANGVQSALEQLKQKTEEKVNRLNNALKKTNTNAP